MITDEGKILHIDFGCAFGQKTKLERLLGIFMHIPNSPFSEDVFIGKNEYPANPSYSVCLAIIGKEDDNEIITKLYEKIKDDLWSCFNALRIHKNRFKVIGEEKDEHFHKRLMIGMTDEEARKALNTEIDKCYNNPFNAARGFYYKLQQNIVS